MIVVFDTNVWLSELGLRSGAGAATRFYLKHRGARIAIPEVIRLEVAQNLTSRLMKHIESIRSDYSQLLTAFGTLREVVLPDEAEVRKRIPELFASMEVEQIDLPFTLESARSSFLKTIHKLPPSHQNQQFKDGVLWADCVHLLSTDEVVLVTADKAFYQDQLYSKGLAASLREEVRGCQHTIRVLPALADLLESVQTRITVDGDMLQAAFIEQHRVSVASSSERHGFALGQRTNFTFNVFATENPAVLFLDFQMDIQCDDLRAEGRTDAVLHLKGDGSYVPASGEFRNLRNFGEHLSFRLADGTVSEMRNVVLHVDGIVLGHREVSNVVRYALPQDEP
ncbi:MAG: hypothetical protein FD121_1447 [Gallionellaceae bacterium]|nr:MAG: hypothetical protein FD121_1447 [Gallionellaceae bacterium]